MEACPRHLSPQHRSASCIRACLPIRQYVSLCVDATYGRPLIITPVDQMILEIGVVDDPEKVGFYSGTIESIFAVMSFLCGACAFPFFSTTSKSDCLSQLCRSPICPITTGGNQ